MATAGLLAACGGPPSPAAAPSPQAGAGAAQPAAGSSLIRPVVGAVGDSAAFGIRVTGIGHGPDRATYDLARPAYITILSITDEAIASITPNVSEATRIEMAGTHTAGLNSLRSDGNRVADRFGPRAARTVPEEDATLAEIAEYNRCLAQARATDAKQREANRRVIGRDSAGRPIYGPPEERAGERTAESYCRIPSRPNREPLTYQSAVQAKPGRYLMVFASDTPVAYRDILELAITETDPRLMAISIGRKLFGPRNGIWSGYVLPW